MDLTREEQCLFVYRGYIISVTQWLLISCMSPQRRCVTLTLLFTSLHTTLLSAQAQVAVCRPSDDRVDLHEPQRQSFQRRTNAPTSEGSVPALEMCNEDPER